MVTQRLHRQEQHGEKKKYEFPKVSHAFEHFWKTERPRIREIETERYI